MSVGRSAEPVSAGCLRISQEVAASTVTTTVTTIVKNIFSQAHFQADVTQSDQAPYHVTSLLVSVITAGSDFPQS